MNQIARSARIAPKTVLGSGNWIGEGVRICENVQIGNGNRIFPGTVLYPNTRLGDNNVILEDCRIGEHPVNMDSIREKMYNGAVIGNRNSVHARATIFGGFTGQTRIGDDNQISHATHVGHDTHITSHVHLYPNAIVAGHCTFLPHSGMGIGAGIHQNRVLGAYAYIGMITAATRNIFPTIIHVGNRATRMNRKRVPAAWLQYEQDLLTLQSLCSREIPEGIETLFESIAAPDLRQHLHDYIAAVRDPSLKAT